MNRRKLLSLLASGVGAIVTAFVGIPAALTALSPVLRREPGPRWTAVGPAGDFLVGATVRAAVEVPRDDWAREPQEKGVYVWRAAEQEFVVFALNCTHLSCPVAYDPGSSWFYCPCHGAIFAQDGSRMHGPASRPLYRYALRLQNGVLEIDLDSLPPMT